MSALADHFPTGCWHQPDDSYAGECSCGASFAGPSYAEAKQAWADHVVAPAVAIGQQEQGKDGTWSTIATQTTEPAVAIGAGEVEPWGGLLIDTAPAACHVLAGRLDRASGEWIMAVVASPPTKPFTHWWPLPGMIAPAPAVAIGAGEVEAALRADIRSIQRNTAIYRQEARAEADRANQRAVEAEKRADNMAEANRKLLAMIEGDSAPASASIPADLEREALITDEMLDAGRFAYKDGVNGKRGISRADVQAIISAAFAARPSTGEKAS